MKSIAKQGTSTRKIQVVGKGRRLVHTFLDAICFIGFFCLVILGYITVLEMVLESFNREAIDPVYYSCIYLLQFLYYFLFELFFQQTPGKMIMKTYVVDEIGNPPSTKQILIRNASRFIPFEAFSCLAKRGWHDILSETFVVHKSELKA